VTTNPKYAPITAAHNWFHGEEKIFRFTIATDEDMTGWTFRWQFRVNEPDDDALLTKEGTGEAELFDAALKQVDVSVHAEDTNAMGPVNGTHALMRVDTNNEGILSFGPALLQQSAVRKG